MTINPIRLKGNWDEGWALDKHVLSSVYVGIDTYGRKQFDTTRTELGELLYNFKYKDRYENLDIIIDLIQPFLDKWGKMKNVDFIIPVPPTNYRRYQPANEIAESIANNYNILHGDDILIKTSNIASKDMDKYNKNLGGTIVANRKSIKDRNVLLVDDLYDTGSTLRECTNILRQDPKIKKIYVLTITKTG